MLDTSDVVSPLGQGQVEKSKDDTNKMLPTVIYRNNCFTLVKHRFFLIKK